MTEPIIIIISIIYLACFYVYRQSVWDEMNKKDSVD